jgi:F420-0:gamma-glutamyl ligase-like protein
MGDITDTVSEPMIVTFRITTDTTFRILTHITATIHHTTPTIPTTEIMDIGILIGMVRGIIAITHPATTRIAISIMARDAHEVIEAPILSAHSPTGRARKWTTNQIELLQRGIVRNLGN